jgi:hypothetical protein
MTTFKPVTEPFANPVNLLTNIPPLLKVRCTLCDRVVYKSSFERHERSKTHRMHKRMRIRELERLLNETQDFDVASEASVAETESTMYDWDGSVSEYDYHPVSLEACAPLEKSIESKAKAENPRMSAVHIMARLCIVLLGVCFLMNCADYLESKQSMQEWGHNRYIRAAQWVNDMKCEVMGCSVAGVSVATLYEIMNRLKCAYGVLRYGVHIVHEAQKRAQTVI